MSGKPILRYAETSFGCTITNDTPRSFIRRMGTLNVRLIRNATQQDIDHVRSMCGRIPEGRIAKPERAA